jgi:hypothetical protein
MSTAGLELLISDGFEAFGAAIEAAIAAAGDDVGARLEAIALGYRRWALDNPEQFGLILGTPVPGFRARVDGPTEASVRRFGEPLVREVTTAYAASRPAEAAGGHAAPIDLATLDPTAGDVHASLLGVIVRSWGRLHGLVALEVFGHLTWSGTDVEALLRTEVRSIMVELTRGVVDATATPSA